MPGLLADLGPLRESPAYRRLFLGSALSAVGSAMTTVAVPVQVYALTGSSFAVGLVGLAVAVPLVTLGLLGGSVADAVDRRRLVLGTGSGLALLSLGLAAQSLADLRQVWLLYLLVALQSGLRAVQAPAQRTFAVRLLGLDRQAAVQALTALSFQLAQVLGPLLAGVLIAASGTQLAYAVDAVSFLASLTAVRRLPPMPPDQGGTRPGPRSVLEGLRFVRRHRVLAGVLLADLDATVFGFPRALFPALAATRLGGGPRTVGLLYAALAVGGLAASVLSGPLVRVARQGLVLLAAIAVTAASFAAFGLARSLWLALALLAAAGAADTVNGVMRGTLIQVLTPDRLRGRVNGVGFVVGAGGPALGDVEAGSVAALTSPVVSTVTGGVVALVGVAAIAAALPGVWRHDARAATAPPPAPT